MVGVEHRSACITQWQHFSKLFRMYMHTWTYIQSNMSWWRHQMETFSALLVIYAGNSPVTSEFPTQRSVTQSFDVFFDLCLNKWLSNNHEAGNLTCHCTHYDFTVIFREPTFPAEKNRHLKTYAIQKIWTVIRVIMPPAVFLKFCWK